MWLGTDPMQGKYPGISTYAFCHNNPIMMRDLDGKDDVYLKASQYEKEAKEKARVLGYDYDKM